ncbi:transcriptional regulator [Brevibacillus sp. LEMMJ03]|uniref:ArpU family phage packaging/lysis transcriptional regulator n=1 Tax=Brevibacillus sp. LEMMJ03 TaxID=2595056 RepID=UPI00117F89F7|nr:ArpU family phage packaging/lysis transcriptional regulator [Brevibacillus sp. LEMMJ03]TRY27447.1 transcriptional regulator [Brevibacillus sp. LEMMJ03]
MKFIDSIPATEMKVIRTSVEAAMEKYRLYKYLMFDERVTRVTASYEPFFHSKTNQKSDQTASVAIQNVDTQAEREAYCKLIERAVDQLPEKEKFLITKRYLEDDYILDYQVYSFSFDPPISEFTYYKIKNRAMYKLALMLGLVKEETDEHHR